MAEDADLHDMSKFDKRVNISDSKIPGADDQVTREICPQFDKLAYIPSLIIWPSYFFSIPHPYLC